jgi:hypothetical protein
MAKAYYSTVFDASAADVWPMVRDFNNYPVWVDGAGASEIEGGKSGDTVGAIRSVLYQGRRIRQRLVAQSDLERTQVYEFVGPIYRPITDFQATIRITPIVDGDRSFVEWWATFDSEPAERAAQTASLQAAFATWLGSLRRAVAGSKSAENSANVAD